jgi:uncharacterized membrane protein YjgN (DUF898 family)
MPAYALLLGAVVLGWLGSSGDETPPGDAPGVLALLPLLMLLALPWLLWRSKRFQHGHYAFASERTAFSAPLTSFYGVFLRALLLAMALGAVFAAAVGLLAPGLFGGMGKPRPGTIGLVLALALLAGLGFQVLLRTYVVARLQNLLWNHTASPHLRFSSRLRARALAALTAKNWLLIVLTLGLYLPFAAVATARLRLQALAIEATTDIDQLLAGPRDAAADAAGDAAADVLGMDIGL